MNWRQYLRPQKVLIHADGREVPTEPLVAWRPKIYLISRAACRFSRIRVPNRNRAGLAAAAMQAAHRQDYTNVRTRIDDVGDGGEVGAWTWNGDFTLKSGAPVSSLRATPETLARRGMSDGARLVRCIDGFEGEIWRDGVLFASRWWREPPSERDWLLFLRAGKASVDDQTSRPVPLQPVWRDDLPIIDASPENLRAALSPARVAVAAGAALAFFLAMETARLVSADARAARIESRIAEALETNAGAYDRRRDALAARAQLAEATALGDPTVGPRALLAVSEEVTREIGALQSFRMFDGVIETRFFITGELDVADLVRRLEARSVLSGVSVERRSANAAIIRASLADDTAQAIIGEGAS